MRNSKSLKNLTYVIKNFDQDPEWMTYQEKVLSVAKRQLLNLLNARITGIEIVAESLLESAVLEVEAKACLLAGKRVEAIKKLQKGVELTQGWDSHRIRLTEKHALYMRFHRWASKKLKGIDLNKLKADKDATLKRMEAELKSLDPTTPAAGAYRQFLEQMAKGFPCRRLDKWDQEFGFRVTQSLRELRECHIEME